MGKKCKQNVLNIKTYVHTLFVRQIVCGVALAIIVGMYLGALPLGILWGTVTGWLDNFFVLRGISKGMEKEMLQAANYMHGTMWSRLGVLLTAVVLGLSLGLTAYSVFSAYLFLHITLIGNMIFLAKQNKPKG